MDNKKSVQCPFCKIQVADLDYHSDICMAKDYSIKDDTCIDNPNNDESHICVKCARIPLI